jgi:signal peptidase II
MLRLGLALALAILVLDRLSKWWLVEVFDLEAHGRVEVTSFFDLVLVMNKGISYGLLQADGLAVQIAIVIIALGICAFLLRWLLRGASKWQTILIGLVIGGALGNSYDRLVYGGVIDFVSLHAFDFYWYVFNIADIAIVTGAGILIYDVLLAPRHASLSEGAGEKPVEE